MRKLLILISAAIGCGGEVEVPSCQDALTHFYDVGCTFTDLSTGYQYTAAEMIVICREARASAPVQCEDELDGLQICLGSVEGPTDSLCNCSSEQEAILTCD